MSTSSCIFCCLYIVLLPLLPLFVCCRCCRRCRRLCRHRSCCYCLYNQIKTASRPTNHALSFSLPIGRFSCQKQMIYLVHLICMNGDQCAKNTYEVNKCNICKLHHIETKQPTILGSNYEEKTTTKYKFHRQINQCEIPTPLSAIYHIKINNSINN